MPELNSTDYDLPKWTNYDLPNVTNYDLTVSSFGASGVHLRLGGLTINPIRIALVETLIRHTLPSTSARTR